jgi:hypothetical protein
MGNFPDDRPQLGVAQSFFETREDRLLVSRFHIDRPVRREPGLGQRWREQILTDAPQPAPPGPCREECSGGSTTPFPPSATSCSAPSAKPPSGRCSSMALIPKGNTTRLCLAPPSRHLLAAETSGAIRRRALIATTRAQPLRSGCKEYGQRTGGVCDGRGVGLGVGAAAGRGAGSETLSMIACWAVCRLVMSFLICSRLAANNMGVPPALPGWQ